MFNLRQLITYILKAIMKTLFEIVYTVAILASIAPIFLFTGFLVLLRTFLHYTIMVLTDFCEVLLDLIPLKSVKENRK